MEMYKLRTPSLWKRSAGGMSGMQPPTILLCPAGCKLLKCICEIKGLRIFLDLYYFKQLFVKSNKVIV